jgi:hypothetical protein
MRHHRGCKRAYMRLSKEYFAAKIPAETIKVMVGWYHKDGGTEGEFEFEWIKLSGELYPRLIAFNDAWAVLWEFKDLLEKMANVDNQKIQEPEFCKLLDSLGIIDITQYEIPKGKLKIIPGKDDF